MRLENDGKGFEHTKDCIRVLDKLGFEFRDALGKCEIFNSLSALLPSRFATTNPNGAWDYSPFFCGAGLAEGLELLYRSAMTLWEAMQEPMLVLHLHNMLVQRGYLKQAISLYGCLEVIFSDSFFSGGQPPTGDYVEAFRSQFSKIRSRKPILQEKISRRVKVTHARDFLNLTQLHLFKQKSALFMYGSADWDPDRVPDSDVVPKSALGIVRLSQTKRVRDPVTSNWRLEQTDFVKQTRATGMSESFIMALDPLFETFRDERQAQMAQMTPYIPDCSSTQMSWLYNINNTSKKEDNNIKTIKYEMTAERMLRILYNDVYHDICGGLRPPFSNLSYIWITIQILLYFEELGLKCQNSSSTLFPLIDLVDFDLNKPCFMQSDERLRITLRALGGKDEELLKLMAKVFERCGGHFIDYTYWDTEGEEAETSLGSWVEDDSSDCCVM
ncbi:hypothetical protein FP744_10009481 [Trichoderma asperellum]